MASEIRDYRLSLSEQHICGVAVRRCRSSATKYILFSLCQQKRIVNHFRPLPRDSEEAKSLQDTVTSQPRFQQFLSTNSIPQNSHLIAFKCFDYPPQILLTGTGFSLRPNWPEMPPYCFGQGSVGMILRVPGSSSSVSGQYDQYWALTAFHCLLFAPVCSFDIVLSNPDLLEQFQRLIGSSETPSSMIQLLFHLSSIPFLDRIRFEAELALKSADPVLQQAAKAIQKASSDVLEQPKFTVTSSVLSASSVSSSFSISSSVSASSSSSSAIDVSAPVFSGLLHKCCGWFDAAVCRMDLVSPSQSLPFLPSINLVPIPLLSPLKNGNMLVLHIVNELGFLVFHLNTCPLVTWIMFLTSSFFLLIMI